MKEFLNEKNAINEDKIELPSHYTHQPRFLSHFSLPLLLKAP